MPQVSLRAAPGRSRSRPLASTTTARAGLSASEKIDVCRGLFAILVASAHALDVAWAIRPGARAALSPLSEAAIRHTAGTGFYWVMGFFVISGFCIQGSASRLGDGRRFPIAAYLMARLTRIFPLYYVALLATLAAEALMTTVRPSYWFHGLDAKTFLWQVLDLQNFTETFGSFASSWSITNEVVYYLLFGLLAFLMPRRGRAAWAGLAVCSTIGVAMLAAYRVVPGRGIILSTGLLFGLGVNWFLGALVAVHEADLIRFRAIRSASAGWPALVVAAILLRADGRPRLELVYLLSGLAFALMLVRFVAVDAGRPAGSAPGRWAGPIRLLGLLSYPAYLFHGPVIMLVGAAILRWGPGVGWWSAWGAMIAATIAVSAAAAVTLEGPIMAWRRAVLANYRGGNAR